ncbi:MAG: AtzH-like domain-containing protein [Ilumatobacteraceae bacterium]
MSRIASTTDDVDDVATVRRAAHEYERCLVIGDGAAAAAFFLDATTVSRFGPEGAQFGPTAVRRLRTASPAVAEPEWLHDEARPVGPGVVLHLALLRRGDAVVQRTQVWTRVGERWHIAHAHVSRVEVP